VTTHPAGKPATPSEKAEHSSAAAARLAAEAGRARSSVTVHGSAVRLAAEAGRARSLAARLAVAVADAAAVGSRLALAEPRVAVERRQAAAAQA
jgi:hypothetical protein